VRSLFAQELENLTRIRVNSINPGRIRTAMRAAAYPGENPNTVPNPETVADLFVYLLSPDSSEINDQYIEAQGPPA
jgi:NAD(P)-dependent dehydrogenase (short-subunit alcohol dehydrogenase family)